MPSMLNLVGTLNAVTSLLTPFQRWGDLYPASHAQEAGRCACTVRCPINGKFSNLHYGGSPDMLLVHF